MRKRRKKYTVLQRVSAALMIVALVWLTISAPFVYAGQQQLAKFNKTADTGKQGAGNEEETCNPFGSTTEEKAPSGINSLSEEYLHDSHHAEYFFSIAQQYHKCENAGTYVAFHGELLVPPPNAA